MYTDDYIENYIVHNNVIKKFYDKKKMKFNNTPLDLPYLNEELVEYSRFLRDIKKTKASLNLDVTNELSKRIIDNSIPLIPSNV